MSHSSSKNLNEKIYQKLIKILPADNISFLSTDKLSYARDMWPRETIWFREGKVRYLPELVVWPQNKEEIIKIIKLSQEEKIPLIPYGAGSGVCGGTLPLTGGIIVDLKKMNKIISLSDISLTVTVESGIIGQHLEMELNRQGYTLGHFPSSIYCSTVGGWLATRSAGQLSTKYGKIEDMVESLEIVLPTGELIKTRPTPRSATGPNFTQLFVGSEGTLGIITTATLKIWPYPESRLFRGIYFPNIRAGLEAIRKILREGVKPAAVRLYDELDTFLVGSPTKKSKIKVEKDNPVISLFKPLLSPLKHSVEGLLLKKPHLANQLSKFIKGKCLLILTFEGNQKICDIEQEIALKICQEEGGEDAGIDAGKHWWDTRYEVSYNLSRIFSGGAFADTMEVATTWDKVAELYFAIREAVSPYALIMAHFSHAYPEGCSIYFSFVGYRRGAEESEKLYEKIWDIALSTCDTYGGTISHHHGVGLLKAKYLEKELGGAFPLYVSLKKMVDPHNILNPGKMGLGR